VTTSHGEASINTLSFSQVFTRTEIRLVQPVWDFGKISAGLAAARAGVECRAKKERARAPISSSTCARPTTDSSWRAS